MDISIKTFVKSLVNILLTILLIISVVGALGVETTSFEMCIRDSSETFPQVKKGAVISAVDLINGIGYYAGLRRIAVEGATGDVYKRQELTRA